jgi:hypothetical protein
VRCYNAQGNPGEAMFIETYQGTFIGPQ